MDTTVLKLQIYIMNHKIFDDDQVEKITLQSMNHAGDHFSDEELLNHLREPPSCTVVRVNTLIADQGSLKDDLISSLVTVINMKEKDLLIHLLNCIRCWMMY